MLALQPLGPARSQNEEKEEKQAQKKNYVVTKDQFGDMVKESTEMIDLLFRIQSEIQKLKTGEKYVLDKAIWVGNREMKEFSAKDLTPMRTSVKNYIKSFPKYFRASMVSKRKSGRFTKPTIHFYNPEFTNWLYGENFGNGLAALFLDNKKLATADGNIEENRVVIKQTLAQKYGGMEAATKVANNLYKQEYMKWFIGDEQNPGYLTNLIKREKDKAKLAALNRRIGEIPQDLTLDQLISINSLFGYLNEGYLSDSLLMSLYARMSKVQGLMVDTDPIRRRANPGMRQVYSTVPTNDGPTVDQKFDGMFNGNNVPLMTAEGYLPSTDMRVYSMFRTPKEKLTQDDLDFLKREDIKEQFSWLQHWLKVIGNAYSVVYKEDDKALKKRRAERRAAAKLALAR